MKKNKPTKYVIEIVPLPTATDLLPFIRENAFETDISYRGGSLKVDAGELFPSYNGQAIIGAYQNYLGGGIAGAIVGAAMFHPDELETELEKSLFPVALEACQQYFFELGGGGGDEWLQEHYSSYEFNQNLPVSAY